jgi:hypothetical protein
MGVYGDCENLFGAILAYHIFVQFADDFPWGRYPGEERVPRAPSFSLLLENRLTKLDAFPADKYVAGAFNQWTDFTVTFSAKGAKGVTSHGAVASPTKGAISLVRHDAFLTVARGGWGIRPLNWSPTG